MQQLGIVGIALSTSCVYICSLAFLLFFLLRNLKAAEQLDLITKSSTAAASTQELL